MKGFDEWKIIRWYCPNCGRICRCYRNKKGVAKSICRARKHNMISIKKNPNKNILTITK